LFVATAAAQSFGIVQAQAKGYVQADCSNIVKQAIDTVSAQCGKTARGKLCYGNSTITAQFQSGVNTSSVKFQGPGDTVDVNALKQFTLGGMDTAANSWGVAEMKIKADLPDADPSLAVTMILFGDVQLSDASNDANQAVLTQTPGAIARQNQQATAISNAINQQATHVAATATKIAGLEATATAHALTPTPTGTILALKATQAAATATKLAALESTATAAPTATTFIPGVVNGPYKGLQAFYFQSSDTAPCDQAPHNGILIQSPQGIKQRVTLVIDGATISLGSTVYITAQPNKFLTVNTLEGSADVGSAGQTQTANAGMAVQVPLDANLRASGTPSPAQFYTEDAIRGLPTRVLPSTSVVYIPGLPPNTMFNTWTVTDLGGKFSSNCPAGSTIEVSDPYDISLAYNSATMWFPSVAFFHSATISADGTYTWTYTDPSSTFVTLSLVIVSPTHITGTETVGRVGGCEVTDAFDMILKSGPSIAPSPSATP